MATARDIALRVLPFFRKNVLAGHVLPYGYYAKAIGLSPEKDSMVIGPAMHAIGAVCIFATIPVAPLHYVKRADKKRVPIFLDDPLESQCVAAHYDTLLVAARVYQYTEQDFERIKTGLEKIPQDWAPHYIWHKLIVDNHKDSNLTYFERALEVYKELVGNNRHTKIEQCKPSNTQNAGGSYVD